MEIFSSLIISITQRLGLFEWDENSVSKFGYVFTSDIAHVTFKKELLF